MDMESTIEGSSLSLALLGVKWQEYFPLTVPETSLKITTCQYAVAEEFLTCNWNRIYRQDSTDRRFLSETAHLSRRRAYYRIAGDFFSFLDGEKCVGIFIGTPIDWSSYYFRNCSILPEYQGLGLYQTLLKHLLSVLKLCGVDRVEGDVAPTNLGHVHILNRLGFVVSGLNLTDRWGSLLHFTRFMNEESSQIFLGQFCHGPGSSDEKPNKEGGIP
jgi:ribosomal protein S18 acetylase RimI-like enzyme